jgi:3-oxoadipate enol-lactonase
MGVVAAASRIGPAALLPQLIPVLPGRLHPLGWALAEVRRHEPAAVVAAAAALGRFTSRDWVGELDVPTTVLVHERDRLVPPRRQEKLGASIVGARVERLDVDHLAVGRSARYVATLVHACTDVRRRAISTGAPLVA